MVRLQKISAIFQLRPIGQNSYNHNGRINQETHCLSIFDGDQINDHPSAIELEKESS